MTNTDTVRTWTPYRLANETHTDPAAPDSTGAAWLVRVRDALADACQDSYETATDRDRGLYETAGAVVDNLASRAAVAIAADLAVWNHYPTPTGPETGPGLLPDIARAMLGAVAGRLVALVVEEVTR